MLWVHPDNVEAHEGRGYVVVRTERTPSGAQWVVMADPKDTCLRKMRDGVCTMDKGHRGRCSTVTFCCESCGKTRRGQPYSQDVVRYYGEVDEVFGFCFMCVEVPRQERRRRQAARAHGVKAEREARELEVVR